MNHEMFEKKFIEILMNKGVDVNRKKFHLHNLYGLCITFHSCGMCLKMPNHCDSMRTWG